MLDWVSVDLDPVLVDVEGEAFTDPALDVLVGHPDAAGVPTKLGRVVFRGAGFAAFGLVVDEGKVVGFVMLNE